MEFSINIPALEMLVEAALSAIGYSKEASRRIALAKAEVEVAKIMVVGGAEIENLQRRIGQTLESHFPPADANNIINTIRRSATYLEPETDPRAISPERMRYIIEKLKLVSREEMQDLWARVINQEAKKPGGYSKVTFDTLAQLEKDDFALFARAAQHVFKFPDPEVAIFAETEAALHDQGWSVDDLESLQDLRLVRIDIAKQPVLTTGHIPPYARTIPLDDPVSFDYFDRSFFLSHTSNPRLPLGSIKLTRAGRELLDFCAVSPNERICNFVLRTWRDWGFSITEQLKPISR